MLDNEGVTIIDARPGNDWSKRGKKITGANREGPSNHENWAHRRGKEEKLVIYYNPMKVPALV